ncbi:MAG TPA: 2-C-methyl-D-erythritol 4-phosphate cytidylyltransferase [Thermoanaerobaculia bacterium]|jgi:2-C-methyl-D-erythritol 4-phosphate cytidylyltransferase
MPVPRPGEDTAPVAAGGARVHALVPAAGRGERFGSGLPKQFVRVRGRTLVAWTVERLLDAGCASVVVALPENADERLHGIRRDERVRLVIGAATRQASVAEALAASPAGASDFVAVHDGARAALAASDFSATVSAAVASGAAILGRRATDTMKRLAADRVVGTADRELLFRAETPQIFRRADLERAIEQAKRERFVGTDESSLVERLGDVAITAVEARRSNPKVTYPEDLGLVERILAAEDRL